MATQLVTPATAYPVDLSTIKLHCRIVAPGVDPTTYTAEDTYLQMLLSGAVDAAEKFLRRALLTQTWDLFLDAFPCGPDTYWGNVQGGQPDWARSRVAGELLLIGARRGDIIFPYPPTQSITSIKYLDADGVQQTLDPSVYEFDAASFPPRAKPVYGQLWPATRVATFNSVAVRFVAGYTSVNLVPSVIKLGILQMIGHWYSNRESVAVGVGLNVADIPQTARSLLWPFRCMVAF